MPIIHSLLDTDLYKLTMMQAILHYFPDVDVEYAFECRTKNIDFRTIVSRVNKEVDNLCSLKFTQSELDYLRGLTFFKKDFADFLGLFHLNRNHINITEKNGELMVQIKGSWLLTILFEVPVLAIINEIYFQNYKPNPNYEDAMEKVEEKKNIVQRIGEDFKFAEFGTRRRYSFDWQDKIIKNLSILSKKSFLGTSNVFFAKKYKIKPIGTMAHEWLQAGQAVGVRLLDSQKYMLQKWVDEYRGNLGIALSDVLGINAFLSDFDLYFSKLYDGIRQDSGDPYEICEKVIKHYKDNKIDPTTKTIIFSDGLNFKKAEKLLQRFKNKIKVAFGIGTNITNDFSNHQALQIVIKMTRCNNQPVAKISDTKAKGMCKDDEYLHYLKKVFEEKMK